MQDLNDIYHFVQVVDSGTFTGASKMLGVAKSQLSFRIARLEENLGVRLIQRTTRRLHVTDVGRLYYEQCLQVLSAAQQAQRVIEETQAVPRGRIRVACPVTFAQILLAPVLARFLRRHPQVQIDLDICGHQTDVVAGGFDISFRVRQSVKDSSLVVRSFGLDPQVLVASPALLGDQVPPQRPKDLRRLPSVSVADADGRHFWTFMGADGRNQQVEHHPQLVTDDLQVLQQAVADGIGIAQLPRWLCREPIARGQMMELLPAYTLPPGNVHAVYPSRHGHTPAVRSFIEFIAEALPQVLQQAQQGDRLDMQNPVVPPRKHRAPALVGDAAPIASL